MDCVWGYTCIGCAQRKTCQGMEVIGEGRRWFARTVSDCFLGLSEAIVSRLCMFRGSGGRK